MGKLSVMILNLIRRLAAALKKLLGPSFFPALAIGSGLVGAGLWLAEHDARIRQGAALADLKKETSASVSNLERQAAADVREANLERAQAVRDLEGREQKLEENAARLRDEIQALESRKQAGLEQAAALPVSSVTSQVTARLGLTAQDLASRPGQRAAPGAAGLPVGDQRSPGATVAGPVRSGAEPVGVERMRTTPPDRPSDPGSTDGLGDRAPPAVARAGWKAGAAAADGEGAPAGGLSEAAWRKIDAALVEGDACRGESAALNREVANLNDQVATRQAMLGQQSAALDKLNQALAAKDQVLAQTEAEHKAELKAARGTRLGRAGRVVKYVVLGVAVGLVIR